MAVGDRSIGHVACNRPTSFPPNSYDMAGFLVLSNIFAIQRIPEEISRGIVAGAATGASAPNKHGNSVPVKVTLVDTLGREAQGEISLGVEPTAKATANGPVVPRYRVRTMPAGAVTGAVILASRTILGNVEKKISFRGARRPGAAL